MMMTRTTRGVGKRLFSVSAADFVTYPTTQITYLPNGIRVATESSPHNDLSCTVGVYIDTGSRYETAENNGVAHFLEHLAFKGTAKRNQVQLESEIENMGGHLNAYTSREMTCYYAQVMKKDTDQAMDILSDILLNSKYDEAAVNRERSTILQEMEHVYQDSKEELIFDHLHETAFQGSPLGFTILGPVENIQKINSSMLRDYVTTHYTGSRMVIAAAGACDHDELVKMAEKYFGGVPASDTQNVNRAEAIFVGSDFQERWDEMQRAYYAIAYPTPGWNHPDAIPLMYFHQLLGEWDLSMGSGENSPTSLVRQYFSDPGDPIVDKYFAFNTLYNDIGLFGIYLVAHPYRLHDAVFTARRAMCDYAYTCTPFELNLVRNKLKANVLFGLDNTAQVSEDIGRQLLTHGRRIHPTEMIARIDDVDVNSLRSTVHKYFIDRDHVSSALGAVYELPDYNEIRIRSYLRRY